MPPYTVLHKLNPAVPQRWLLLIAGIMWTGVGAMLCLRSLDWFHALHNHSGYFFGAAGIALAFVAYRFMLAKAARKNITRISLLPQRAGIFSFTPWKGYMMIAIMMTAGITLRHSSIPRQDLAPFYLAMGGALILGSLEFFIGFWSCGSQKKPEQSAR